MSTSTTAACRTAATDHREEHRKLRRHLGCCQLPAIGSSGVIGSGWLLGAHAEAQAADL